MDTFAPSHDPASLERLQHDWRAAWPSALVAWSKFTRLQEPRWCMSAEDSAREGIRDSFAMIRLNDQAVVVDLRAIVDSGVQAYPREILAHEVGHHVLAPANLADHARCIARMRWALPTVEPQTPMIANLYTDLLINDRLERSAGLPMTRVFLRLHERAQVGSGSNPLWELYMRTYEILWSLRSGSLTAGAPGDRIEGDAQIGARLVRAYSRDWLDGAGRFAALCLPYLLEQAQDGVRGIYKGWLDTRDSGAGGAPAGLVDVEPGEREGAIHPALDAELTGIDHAAESGEPAMPPAGPSAAPAGAAGQSREPFEYGEILRSAGVTLSESDAAARYYRERALPHLIRYPVRSVPESRDPLPEGLLPWDIGGPLDEVDWFQSVLVSPTVVPGLTTMQRAWGTSPGNAPDAEPLWLDLYVDSSGSMPNPRIHTSYLTLAGAIIALSALRAGARVQATLWSGKHQVIRTEGFVRSAAQILDVLTGYFGGGTAFPIHVLRDTYQAYRPAGPAAHILVISDDGVTTMFDGDEQNNRGWDIAALALKNGRGGGTLVLNLARVLVERIGQPARNGEASVITDLRAAAAQGWRISAVQSWPDLIAFARAFSAITYGAGTGAQR